MHIIIGLGNPGKEYHRTRHNVGFDVLDVLSEKLNIQITKSGYSEALYSMGVWIERGYLGKPDMKKVLDLYEQAANKGHTNAKKSLVVLYAEGHGGFPKNLERKQFWLRNLNKGK